MKTGRRVNNRITDNRGISLVELIVVIAIMSVMVGVTSLGIGMMFTRDAEYVAVRIDDELTEARTLAMSRAGVYTYVLHTDSTDTEAGYVRIDVTDDAGTTTEFKKVLLDKSVTITATGATFDASGNISIVFDKVNGSVSTVNGTAPSSGTMYTFKVTSTKNSSKTKDVTLVSTTGKHFTK